MPLVAQAMQIHSPSLWMHTNLKEELASAVIFKYLIDKRDMELIYMSPDP
jgi:hypothetical protein